METEKQRNSSMRDPFWEGHDQAWLDEYKKNLTYSPGPVCNGCIHRVPGGACSIHDWDFQSSAVMADACPDFDLPK